MNPDIMQTSLTRIVAPIVLSACTTALSTALLLAGQFKGANAKETTTQKPEDNKLVRDDECNYAFRDWITRYNAVGNNYKSFKFTENPLTPLQMLYVVGSNFFPPNFDPYHNSPLTRLVANQRFGLVKAIMDEVGDPKLLKDNPALTKRFLEAPDKNGINFLEMSSRFYGVMPEELLTKVVSLYAENAEPESIKLTPAILSLPEKLFNSLLPKINKTGMEEFTNHNVSEKEIYDKIVESRNKVGLSKLVIYVKEGLENSVLANYKPENDGFPDQYGSKKLTSDESFEYPQSRTGTIASDKLSKRNPEEIRKQVNRPDLDKDDQEALTKALLNKNPLSAIMAKENAMLNIKELKRDFCPSNSPTPKEVEKVVNNEPQKI